MPKNPDMPLQVVLASVFHWLPGGTVAAAEASDFGPVFRSLRRQVWSDACDEGFLVKGKRETHLFVFSHEKRDNEGELTHSVFVDHNDVSGRRRIHIYND